MYQSRKERSRIKGRCLAATRDSRKGFMATLGGAGRGQRTTHHTTRTLFPPNQFPGTKGAGGAGISILSDRRPPSNLFFAEAVRTTAEAQ